MRESFVVIVVVAVFIFFCMKTGAHALEYLGGFKLLSTNYKHAYIKKRNKKTHVVAINAHIQSHH